VVGLVAVVGIAWWVRQRRNPDFPRWELGFLFLAGALLASKVYSPQYSLWLLPWFALIGVSPWLFAAFEAAEVAVFLTRFSWFGRLFHDVGRPGFATYHGFPIGAFEVTVLVRDALLLLIIWKWATREERSADRHSEEGQDHAQRGHRRLVLSKLCAYQAPVRAVARGAVPRGRHCRYGRAHAYEIRGSMTA